MLCNQEEEAAEVLAAAAWVHVRAAVQGAEDVPQGEVTEEEWAWVPLLVRAEVITEVMDPVPVPAAEVIARPHIRPITRPLITITHHRPRPITIITHPRPIIITTTITIIITGTTMDITITTTAAA